MRPPTLLNGVITVPVEEPVSGARQPCGKLDRRLASARDALIRVEWIDMDERVSRPDARKLRLAIDNRHPIRLDNSRRMAGGGRSQSLGALGVDIAE
jgi:hypothetical protein